MSFYDLAKDNVLSANELFKYRLKRDATVPSKGGQKAFEPDGSWMQAKALESFMKERTNVLSEQRVEKVKSLVEGEWEAKKRLVNLNKPGKFWAHMGFTDKRRNWLYPEEALFLMETNAMEVYYKGLPLSIQEAYTTFIGPDLSIEEYQVYAHLRRLGYVVLRQDSELKITPYERQINLDTYMSKKEIKKRKKASIREGTTTSDEKKTSDSLTKDGAATKESNRNVENPESEPDKSSCLKESACTESKDSASSNLSGINSSKRTICETDDADSDSVSKRLKVDTEDGKQSEQQSDDHSSQSWYADSCWAECFRQFDTSISTHDNNVKSDSEKTDENTRKVEAFHFPSIANKDILNLKQPSQKLLPPNVDMNEDYNDILLFNVQEYRSKHPLPKMSKTEELEGDRQNRIGSLDFSFAEWMQKKPWTQAQSWAKFKKPSLNKPSGIVSAKPTDHLWSGKVTPLVRPGDAFNKKTILDRLSIIQTADNDTLLPSQDCMVVDLKVSFSVHLPDSKFKKSMPGVPNHRVCVTKCSSEPPNLADIQDLWSRFKDDVPLHCAVVDSGEIAFYIFDNTFQLEMLP